MNAATTTPKIQVMLFGHWDHRFVVGEVFTPGVDGRYPAEMKTAGSRHPASTVLFLAADEVPVVGARLPLAY